MSDKLDLIDHLLLNEGAYFYKTEKQLTKEAIKKIFTDVLDGIECKVLTKVYKNENTSSAETGNKKIKYSLLIFRFKSYPSFFDFDKGDFPDALIEEKLAYLLIVEIDSNIVFVKKNISHLNTFINSLTQINADTLTGVLIDESTRFQQMKLSNMSLNGNSLRNKSYEANDLENAMPMYGSNHAVVNKTRFTNTTGLCDVNISTSRLAKYGEKVNLSELLERICALTTKINSYSPSHSFLTRFAKPQLWDRLHQDLEPTSVLIDIFTLNSYIQTLDCKDVFFKKSDTEKNISSTFARIIKSGINSITFDANEKDLYYLQGKRSIGIKKLKSCLKICVRDRDQSVKNIYYQENDGRKVRILDLINQLGCFSVGFNDHSYIYTSKRLYMNASILDDFDSILAILTPIEKFNEVQSEKGKLTQKSTEFPNGSMFHIVEKYIFHNAQFLLCDDLGNEWADHIAISGTTISYIHSKCNDGLLSLSASKFQEVIGQALKNVGNMNPDSNAIQKKKERMNGTWGQTAITKCRKGTPELYENLHNKLRCNPNNVREICLAVNFLSKSELENAFNKIKNNQPLQQKYSIMQLAWLLSSFISTCKEADLNCRIFCRV